MNFKIQNLYTKVYSEFIKGSYGKPIIPSKNQVLQKINEITTEEYLPLMSKEKMDDINISGIQKSFSNIIDDLDILFNSIESESKEVLDQLTNSLKEHNGIKRELRDLQISTLDISNGKLGEEFLKYNFTDSFNSSTYINTQKSDPVNFEAGLFTIGKNDSNLLSLEHYRGSKIDFIVVENHSQIIEQEYVGSADCSAMLDTDDPRQVLYKIKTSTPTKLRTHFTIQLSPNGSLIDINSVDLDVDSDIAKGYIRLYYKDEFKWKDVPTQSIQEIKSNHVVFNFPNTKTTHIKIEFIKDSPDSFDTNTYYYAINNIAIMLASTKRSATLFSKPIEMQCYGNELPIIFKLSVSGDVDIPKNCSVDVFVAQDVKISGAFLSSGNLPTNFDSPDVYKFDNSYPSGDVFLSELINGSDAISGVLPYKSADFKWYNIKFTESTYEQIQEKVEFDNTIKNNKIVNSIFCPNNVLFGDLDFTGILGISGWVNTDNENWNILEDYVASGYLVSGVTIGGSSWDIGGANWNIIQDSNGNLHPSISGSLLYSGQWIGYGSGVGYPFNFQDQPFVDTIRFNDYSQSINGWWRPFSNIVTDSGIHSQFAISGYLKSYYNTRIPDFHFNNIPFYKIYKFNKYDSLINSTLKLYSYQESPTLENGSNGKNLYPCNFSWNYNTDSITKNSVKEKLFDPLLPTTWSGYIIPLSGILGINESWVFDSISELRIHNTSIILQPSEYFPIVGEDLTLSGIDLSPLQLTQPTIVANTVKFDMKYSYKVKNNFLSTWTSFAIVNQEANNPSINIPNRLIYGTNKYIIDSYTIKDLDTDQILEEESSTINNIEFKFPKKSTEGHYKITLFCGSNSYNGFCANNWVPFVGDQNGDIQIGDGVKMVNKITPINIVGFDTLLYDSSFGLERAAIINEANERYIVVKVPNKDNLPGYYFNSIDKKYETLVDKLYDNKNNWIRQNFSGYFTTGSSGLYVFKKNVNTSGLNWSAGDKNYNWNGGATLKDLSNYNLNRIFDFHSTYGYSINLEDSDNQTIRLYTDDIDPRAPKSSGVVGSTEWIEWYLDSIYYESDDDTWFDYKYVDALVENRGFLFYNTAENLPSYYSISYRLSSGTDDTNNRFLYKIVLNSNEKGSLVPKVRSIRFMVNED
jgi:hypothetical protein